MEEKENLWNSLASRKAHSTLVDFPDYDEKGQAICQVLIKTLSHDEHIKIQKDSMNECDRSFIEEKEKINRESDLYKDRYENIAAKHFLFHCCFEPDNPEKKLFPIPQQVGKLTQDEVNVLLKHYRTLQNQKGPLVAYLTGDQFEEWVTKLADSAEEGAYFLDRILPEAQIQLLLYMANQLSEKTKSPMVNCSPILQPNESIPNTKMDPPQLPEMKVSNPQPPRSKKQ